MIGVLLLVDQGIGSCGVADESVKVDSKYKLQAAIFCFAVFLSAPSTPQLTVSLQLHTPGRVVVDGRRESPLIVCTCMHIVSVSPPCAMKPASMLSLCRAQNSISHNERGWTTSVESVTRAPGPDVDPNDSGTKLGVAMNFTTDKTCRDPVKVCITNITSNTDITYITTITDIISIT